MTRSNFDPTNPDSERTGRGGLDRYLGPEAQSGSQIPGEIVDGEVEEEAEAAEDIEQSHEELSTDEAARRLDEMQRGKDAIENSPDTPGQVE